MPQIDYLSLKNCSIAAGFNWVMSDGVVVDVFAVLSGHAVYANFRHESLVKTITKEPILKLQEKLARKGLF